MEDIAKATQIYMNRDMEINRWLVQRAKAAGYSAIVLTAGDVGPGQSYEFSWARRSRPVSRKATTIQRSAGTAISATSRAI
jgi:isopentenyl diphosphate isomerase/L-lactate dehydrogenase-like FMN-dependent dehydrogenase